MNEIWISIAAITISCLSLFYTIHLSSKQRVINSSRLKTDLLTKLVTIKILFERKPRHFDLLVSEAHGMRSIYADVHCDPLNPLYEENKKILHHLDDRVQAIESYKETHELFLAKQISLYDTLLMLKNSNEKKLEELRYSIEVIMLYAEELSETLIKAESNINFIRLLTSDASS